MQPLPPDLFDYKKFAILYVDDEEKSLKMFAQAFGRNFRVYTASTAAAGFQILEEHHAQIGLLMTDQRMPGEKGVRLLERARQHYPRIIRILTTAYADMDAAISAVNTGAIYKYISKPWEIAELEQTLRHGLQFFQVQHERDQLLREKLSTLHHAMIADRIISLGILSAGLSHHLRNSLVAVRTFLDLAPAKLEEEKVEVTALRDPAYWRNFYDQVQSQIKKITEMLDGLGLAADQTPCLAGTPVRLDQILAEALAKAGPPLQAKQIQLQQDVPATLPALPGDAHKLRRLFELLLQEEATYLPEGGHIHLTAQARPGQNGQPEELLIQIQDDGPGLSPEALRSLFDPFFTRVDNPQEFGINLMACYFIVHHHGGRIEVKNREPNGAIFQITLPLHPKPAAQPLSDTEFISKALLNNQLWEKLLVGQ